MNELIFHNFNAVADATGGDMMLVLTETSTIEEIVQYILFNKIIWFYDGQKYRAIIHFEDIENGAIIYYFNDSGEIISHQFGGDS